MIAELALQWVAALSQWVIYTSLLWIMIKIQRLNYNLLGLIAASAAAILVGRIPIVGRYLSHLVLVIGLWKCTKADLAPDILFTVAVTGALMFCVNLFGIGAMMGDLRPSAVRASASAATHAASVARDDGEEQAPEPTSIRQAAAKAAPTWPVPKGISLKGVMLRSAKPMAMIGCGQRIFTVAPGEMFALRSAQGDIQVRCEEITRTAVRLIIDDHPIELLVK